MSNQNVVVPDLGGSQQVDVIEILVKVGDVIDKETPLITLESEKASMEVPSPVSGTVKSIDIKLGDKVSPGDTILTVAGEPTKTEPNKKQEESTSPHPERSEGSPESKTVPTQGGPSSQAPRDDVGSPIPLEVNGTSIPSVAVYAGPGVRRLAQELGVDLSTVTGTGRKDRITQEDVHAFVKNKLSQGTVGGFSLPSAPKIDFSQFGAIEVKLLGKIKRLTGLNMHRSWITVPHVTQFDEADITELEIFRKQESEKAQGYKLTILAFVCKVVAKALKEFPQFNSSLDETGEQLIFKKYVNIGIAVDTPGGLVVPVIKELDKLSVIEIAKQMQELSKKAREKQLLPGDFAGGSFTISSLGGVGGTAFTPIVNYPEVAILGLSRAITKPVYQKDTFVPRLMLPLSLSYDHRVIDGAEAARFTQYLSQQLSDIRRVLL